MRDHLNYEARRFCQYFISQLFGIFIFRKQSLKKCWRKFQTCKKKCGKLTQSHPPIYPGNFSHQLRNLDDLDLISQLLFKKCSVIFAPDGTSDEGKRIF